MNRATVSRITNNEIERKMNIALFDFSNEQTSPAKEIYLPDEMYNDLKKIHGKVPTTFQNIKVSPHPLETIKEIIVI